MIPSDSRHRLILLAIGILVLFGPGLIIVATLGALVLFADLALGQITTTEFLELYIIEFILFVVLAYGIYRLTLWLVEHQVPSSLDALESLEPAESPEDGSERFKDR